MVNIRRFESRDYDSLRRNLEQAGLFYPTMDSFEHFQEKSRKDPESIIVAEEGSNIIGSLYFTNDAITTLHRLAVAPEYRKNGVARQLFESAEEVLRKRRVEEITLFVEQQKPYLIEMYQRWGYERKEPFIRMSKMLEY